jgi:hypothetical protein
LTLPVWRATGESSASFVKALTNTDASTRNICRKQPDARPVSEVAQTHRGVRSVFARVAKVDARFERAFAAFLARACWS